MMIEQFIGCKIQRCRDEDNENWEDLPGILCKWVNFNNPIKLFLYDKDTGRITCYGGEYRIEKFRVHPDDRYKINYNLSQEPKTKEKLEQELEKTEDRVKYLKTKINNYFTRFEIMEI